eukprot:Gb_25369 [translate_table: standard]
MEKYGIYAETTIRRPAKVNAMDRNIKPIDEKHQLVFYTGRDGNGDINKVGLDYYNGLIDALLAKGIHPYVTLFHWDLPQALEDIYDGWLNPHIIGAFVKYATACFEAFGDRVKNSITFNEPHGFSIEGYDMGLQAPGRCVPFCLTSYAELETLPQNLVPVYLASNFDNDKGSAHFEYITRPRYSNFVGNLEPCQGCDCIEGCAGEKCSCILRNGAEVPYNQNGILINKKPLIYECGDKCKCPPSCRNSTTQKGLKNHLEVFKTSDRGFGVRCWDSIAVGTFIYEYTGEVVSEEEAALQHEGNEYILSAMHSQERWTDWGSIVDILCKQKQQDVSSQAPSSFSSFVDASKMGNVSRFINHSCSPNVFIQFILHDHQDTRFSHIVFFATENIPPLTELTFDYGTNVPRVGDIEGSGGYKGASKSKVCLCGASNCKGNFVR